MTTQHALAQILLEIGAGELAFPTHAALAERIRRGLDDPNLHPAAAARLIQSDPLLAARIVGVANSAAFSTSGRALADVRSAIFRLGLRSVRPLVVALMLRQLEGGPGSLAQQRCAARLWEHTAHVAALAQVLARRVTRIDPDVALFAGIVHEVGNFYLLSRAAEFPGLLDSELADLDAAAEALVGCAVLRALAVPERVTGAIECHWEGYLGMPPETLGDTLLLADRLAPVPSPFHQSVARCEKDAPSSIEFLIGEEALSAVLDDSAQEVLSITKVLQL